MLLLILFFEHFSITLERRSVAVQDWSASVEASWGMHLVHNELFHSVSGTHFVEMVVLYKTKIETIASSSLFLPVDETGLPESLLESGAQTKKLRLEVISYEEVV